MVTKCWQDPGAGAGCREGGLWSGGRCTVQAPPMGEMGVQVWGSFSQFFLLLKPLFFFLSLPKKKFTYFHLLGRERARVRMFYLLVCFPNVPKKQGQVTHWKPPGFPPCDTNRTEHILPALGPGSSLRGPGHGTSLNEVDRSRGANTLCAGSSQQPRPVGVVPKPKA